MIIKQASHRKKKIFSKRNRRIVSTITLVFGFVGTTVFYYAISTEKNPIVSLINQAQANLVSYFNPSPYKLGDSNTFGSGFQEGRPDIQGVPRISIDIKHKHWESLKIQREMSLKARKFVRFKDNYVPAKIRFKNKSHQARVRFKGMTIDHIKEDKWSYRIILKKGKTLFGMKQFSIQHPSQRNWLYEKIVHLAMKREGLLGLRYDFIYVTINGKDMGLYALEEHFEKRLVENNRRHNGPIVKLTGSRLSKFDSAKSNMVQRDPVLHQQYKKATSLLVALANGDLTVSDVFDVEKLAKFSAIIDLFAAYHGAHWSSSRMYYNPVTSRIEIFSYDNLTLGYFDWLIGAGRSYFQAEGKNNTPFFNFLFNDPKFYKAYVKALEQVSQKSYLEKMLADLKNEIDRNEKLLKSEWVNFSFTKGWFFDPSPPGISSIDFLYRNQEKIRAIVSAKGMVEAHYQNSKDGKIALALKNSSPMPIEVMGIDFEKNLHKPLKAAILPVKRIQDKAPVRLVYFSESDFGKTPITSLKLKYKVMGGSKAQEANISPHTMTKGTPFKASSEISPSPNVKQGLSCHPPYTPIRDIKEINELKFVDVKKATREIIFRNRLWDKKLNMYLPWVLKKGIVIPEGYQVIIEPESKISFFECSSIMSYSPVTFTGTRMPFNIFFLSRDITREISKLDEYAFLDVREENKEIIIRKGTWELSRNIVIPKGYKLIAKPGAKIDLSNRAIMLSYSPISFLGTEEAPIVIQSPNNDGGGLAVLNADGESDIRHTIFRGLSAPESDGWKLTGAVTFYESDTNITNSKFLNNNSEDSLHIIRSKVRMSETYFKNSRSDAFDGDFVKARIENSQFHNSGNDAVDISGSSLIMTDVQINKAGDKGLSAGENSQASLEHIKIKLTNIAIASKDMSTVIARDILINDSAVGFAAYQKKSEFGPAVIKATRVIGNTSTTPFVLESQSTLLMDGVEKTVNQKKVYKALYPKTN
jgi:hypothetical protein